MLYLYLDPGKLLLLYRLCLSGRNLYKQNLGNDSNLLIVFYVQIMPDDLVMQTPPILRTTVTSVPALPDVVSDSGYVAQCAECNAC